MREMWMRLSSVAAWLSGVAVCAVFLWFAHNGQPNMGGDLEAAFSLGAVGSALM
jgi:hypothetical protein